MAARFPDRYYTDLKYSVRGKGGRFVRADSPEAQEYVLGLLGKTAEQIEKMLWRDCRTAASRWSATHLSPRPTLRKASDASVPFDTGNLLASTSVGVWGSEEANFQQFYSPHKPAKEQHWGVPKASKGRGFGYEYLLETGNPMEMDIRQAQDMGIMGAAGGIVGVMLSSGIPYAGPVNTGTIKNPFYIGWFTNLARSLGRAIMSQTGVVGYDIETEIMNSFGGSENGGLVSTTNYLD